jgi:hypothetical protein
MEYLAIAYALIAVVLVGYAVNLRIRTQTIERERARLESRNK